MPKYAIVNAALIRLAQNHRRLALVPMGMLGALAAALLIFGLYERPAAAQSEPQTVGRVTGLTATAAGQPDGTVRLTWNAAENAQVYFVYYIEQKEKDASNWANGQMRAFTGNPSAQLDRIGRRREVPTIIAASGYALATLARSNPCGEVLGLLVNRPIRNTLWRSSVRHPVLTSLHSLSQQTVGPGHRPDKRAAEGQPPGTVRLTWSAAENAQVYYGPFTSSTMKQRYAGNWSANGQMRAFTATQGTITGLDGLVGGEYLLLSLPVVCAGNLV